MKKILAFVMMVVLCMTMIPAFAVSADTVKTVNITVDGNLGDWEGLNTLAIVGSDNTNKKATFYGTLAEDGSLYLACDAYHDVLKTDKGEWWQNSNFECFVEPADGQGHQFWIRANGETPAKEGRVYKAAMKTEEINGTTKYHTTSELVIPSWMIKPNGNTVKVGLAWKTEGDDIANGGNWWRVEGTNPPDKQLFVSAAGIYKTNDEASNAASGFKTTAPVYDAVYTDAVANGQYPADTWTVDGKNYTHTAEAKLPDFDAVVLGASNKTVTLSMTVDNTVELTQSKPHSKNERAFLFGISNINGGDKFNEVGDYYYLVDFTSEKDGDGVKTLVGLERNTGGWTGWRVEKWLPAELNTESMDITVKYGNGCFEIYVNDTMVAMWKDASPLPGTSYAVAAKSQGITLKNVTAVENDDFVGVDTEIDTPAEFAKLAQAANASGDNFMVGTTFKITADLDMTGINWTPFKCAKFLIDGQGHTISNINLNVGEVASGNYGLIAMMLGNNNFNGCIKNVTIADSTLTVKSTAENPNDVKVGAVAGFGDRAYASDITLSGVTVNVEGKAYVGGIIGVREWHADAERDNGVKNIKFEYTTINAADATVGLVYGRVQNDCKEGEISAVSGKVCVTAANEVTSATVIAVNEAEKPVADSAKGVTILTTPEEKPVTPPETVPETKPVTPAPTGSPVIGLSVLAAVALAGVAVFSKKRYN